MMQKRRLLRSYAMVVLFVSLWLLTSKATPRSPQQGTCTTSTACASTCTIPLRSTKLTKGTTYGVCAEATITGHANSSALQSGISQTVSGWNNALSSISSADRPTFTVSCTSTRQIKVKVGDCPVEGETNCFILNPDNLGGSITVEAATAGGLNSNAATSVFSHETGHLVGLGDANSQNGCAQSDTIMFRPVDGSQSFRCSPSDCDKNRTKQQYPSSCPPTPGCSNWNSQTCNCEDDAAGGGGPWGPGSPIIIAVGQSSEYRLTSLDGGVRFDLNSNGAAEEVSWTRADESIAFLVLDRNQNGLIDNGSELFGNFTPLEGDATAVHGFEALAAWDSVSGGGNGDGWIDPSDTVWSRLQLWVDRNHNGMSEPPELFSLATYDISRISIQAYAEARRDQHGNTFRFRGQFIINGHPRWAYDVFFVGRE